MFPLKNLARKVSCDILRFSGGVYYMYGGVSSAKLYIFDIKLQVDQETSILPLHLFA